jgi:hypothetical protein
MSSQPVVASDQRQREVRARALDENFDAQRRQIGERVAVMFRWIFLAVLTALVNLNIVVTLLLIRGFRPGRQFSLSTMTMEGPGRAGAESCCRRASGQVRWEPGAGTRLGRSSWPQCDPTRKPSARFLTGTRST